MRRRETGKYGHCLPALLGVAYVWEAVATPCTQLSREEKLSTVIDIYLNGMTAARQETGREGGRGGGGLYCCSAPSPSARVGHDLPAHDRGQRCREGGAGGKGMKGETIEDYGIADGG